MWLLKKLRPDHKAIADFRKNNLKPIRQVCREFTLLCKQLDLFAGELVAIDGSKFKAVNAKERTFTSDKLKNLLQQIDQCVEGYLKDLEGQDNDDDAGTPGGAVVANLQAKIETLQAKEVLGCTFDAVADVGSYHGEEVQTCLAAGLTPSVARPITLANQQRGLFSKDDFTSDGATDTSQGPAGARLTFRLATVELGQPIRYDATSACRAYPLKPQSTRNPGG